MKDETIKRLLRRAMERGYKIQIKYDGYRRIGTITECLEESFVMTCTRSYNPYYVSIKSVRKRCSIYNLLRKCGKCIAKNATPRSGAFL